MKTLELNQLENIEGGNFWRSLGIFGAGVCAGLSLAVPFAATNPFTLVGAGIVGAACVGAGYLAL